MLELHKTRKDYHRYQNEQKLPSCLRHNLKNVTIHNVINRGIDKEARLKQFSSSFPKNFYTLYSKMHTKKLHSFIYNAFSYHNTKAIRIVFKRFKEQFKYMIDNGLLQVEMNDHFISVNNMHINSKHLHWYSPLKEITKSLK